MKKESKIFFYKYWILVRACILKESKFSGISKAVFTAVVSRRIPLLTQQKLIIQVDFHCKQTFHST